MAAGAHGMVLKRQSRCDASAMQAVAIQVSQNRLNWIRKCGLKSAAKKPASMHFSGNYSLTKGQLRTAMSEPTVASIYNYRAVNESLCTSGQPSAAQLREIAAAGFSTVINLALHDDPRYSLLDEAGIVHASGMAYVHIPVQFSAPTEANLLEFFAAMDAHEGEKIWLHCAANFRVSAFIGLYRVIRQGAERTSAFALMDSLWQADEVWSSFISSMLKKLQDK
jgi:protein tyrosine phosphatase (PTP) superfamily phosphohydrolase (DUF442 family)